MLHSDAAIATNPTYVCITCYCGCLAEATACGQPHLRAGGHCCSAVSAHCPHSMSSVSMIQLVHLFTVRTPPGSWNPLFCLPSPVPAYALPLSSLPVGIWVYMVAEQCPPPPPPPPPTHSAAQARPPMQCLWCAPLTMHPVCWSMCCYHTDTPLRTVQPHCHFRRLAQLLRICAATAGLLLLRLPHCRHPCCAWRCMWRAGSPRTWGWGTGACLTRLCRSIPGDILGATIYHLMCAHMHDCWPRKP
jgi:hypothetical protein